MFNFVMLLLGIWAGVFLTLSDTLDPVMTSGR